MIGKKAPCRDRLKFVFYLPDYVIQPPHFVFFGTSMSLHLILLCAMLERQSGPFKANRHFPLTNNL